MKAITCVAALLLAVSAAAGGKDAKAAPGPAYDRNSETKFLGKVTEVRELGQDHALAGVYLSIKTEKGENVSVYVGPQEFIKLFDVTFSAGEDVEVRASKVKFDGSDLFLAREIRMGQVTLILRDDSGSPNWDWIRPRVPTGL